MNSITKTGSQTMKTTALLTARAGRMISACVACLALTQSASADTIVTRLYDTPKAPGATVTFSDVLETATNPPNVTLGVGLTPPATWLYPPEPTVTSDNKLSFNPINFTTTVSNLAYSGMHAIDDVKASIVPDAGVGPMMLDVLIRGAWTFLPSQLAASQASSTSLADFGASARLDIVIRGLSGVSGDVNYSGLTPMLVDFSPQMISGSTNQTGTWQGRVTMSWDDIKTVLLPAELQSQQITKLNVSVLTDIFSESQYAQATTRVNELTIAAQPVPEPPTIILAGLGAAAAVGHGYRRRKLRQRDAEGSDAEWNAEEGAIALTA
jgi:hypothetical protein